MAESLMSQSLDITRAKLRKHLLPDAQGEPYELDADGDHFPRSKVMRFAFDPRNRRLLMFSGSALALLLTRVVGASQLTMMTDLARSFTRNKS
jgi:hypothetical protein